MNILGFPPDTDWTRWTMFHNVSNFCIVAFRVGSVSEMYQGTFDGRSYVFGHDCNNVIHVRNTPSGCTFDKFAMLFDNIDCRMYVLSG
jgi:hypothetical protein